MIRCQRFDWTNLALLLAVLAGIGLTVWKCCLVADRAAERQARVAGCAGAARPVDERFIGRWRLVDAEGRTGGWLNVTRTGPHRGHAPNVDGTWECSGAEMRIAWDDGFLDVLRSDGDGSELLALDGAGGVRFRLRAERRRNE